MTGFLALAGGDCERRVAGLFGQPTNALSSLAFLAVGLWIVRRGRRAAGHRSELTVFGLAVAANAVGGLLFHGPEWPGARWVHDASILSVLLFIVVFDLARLLGRAASWTVGAYAVSLLALGLVLALAPGATYATFAALSVTAGAMEVAEYRRELPVVRAEGLTARRLARLGVLVALALAATAFFVGRSGAPLCNPLSAFQWHAVWHVLAAMAMGLYAYGAIEPHPVGARADRARARSAPGSSGGGGPVPDPTPARSARRRTR